MSLDYTAATDCVKSKWGRLWRAPGTHSAERSLDPGADCAGQSVGETGEGPEFAEMATYVRGELLVRMSPNRYSLALAVFHQYCGATFFVADTHFELAKPFI